MAEIEPAPIAVPTSSLVIDPVIFAINVVVRNPHIKEQTVAGLRECLASDPKELPPKAKMEAKMMRSVVSMNKLHFVCIIPKKFKNRFWAASALSQNSDSHPKPCPLGNGHSLRMQILRSLLAQWRETRYFRRSKALSSISQFLNRFVYYIVF